MKILHEGYFYSNREVDSTLQELESRVDNKMRYKFFDVRDGGTKDNSVIVFWTTQEDYDNGMLEEFREEFEKFALPVVKKNSDNIDRVILKVNSRNYPDEVDTFEYSAKEEVKESLTESTLAEELVDFPNFPGTRSIHPSIISLSLERVKEAIEENDYRLAHNALKQAEEYYSIFKEEQESIENYAKAYKKALDKANQLIKKYSFIKTQRRTKN